MRSATGFSAVVAHFYSLAALLSILFNLCLIYLVVRKSLFKLGAYKYLMIINSVMEMMYSLMDAFLVPVHYSQDSSIVELISVPDKSVGRSTLFVLHFIYCGFYGCFLSMFALHFIYRYFVIREHKLLYTFNSWRLLFWLLIPITTGFVYSFNGVYLCGSTPKTSDLLRDGILAEFGRSIDDYEYAIIYLFEKTPNGGTEIHFVSAVTLIIMMGIITPSFCTIVYFGSKCYQRIKSLISMTSSDRLQKLQSQLFYALVVQTTIPIVLMHIPVTIMLSVALMDIDVGTYTMFVSISVSSFSVIDPLPNFIMIKPYREAILGVFKCNTLITTVQSSHAVQQQLVATI